MRTSILFAFLLTLLAGPYSAVAQERPPALIYKNPQCSCCEGYADYLRQHGYTVTTKPTHNLSLIRRQMGVPEKLAGCHTTLIDKYVVEGHVPVGAINKLLAERPDIKGISLPGMPEGSPGMTGAKAAPFEVLEIREGAEKVYATE